MAITEAGKRVLCDKVNFMCISPLGIRQNAPKVTYVWVRDSPILTDTKKLTIFIIIAQ